MKRCIRNMSDVTVLVDFKDGREELLHPGRYIIFDGDADITKGAQRELVDVGIVEVWEVEPENIYERVGYERVGKVQWQKEGF